MIGILDSEDVSIATGVLLSVRAGKGTAKSKIAHLSESAGSRSKPKRGSQLDFD